MISEDALNVDALNLDTLKVYVPRGIMHDDLNLDSSTGQEKQWWMDLSCASFPARSVSVVNSLLKPI